MSDRIEQLAKEYHFVHEFMTTGERNDALQKYKAFAKLIIAECVQICDDHRSAYTKLCKESVDFVDKNLYAEGEASAHRIRFSIEKHFGVSK